MLNRIFILSIFCILIDSANAIVINSGNQNLYLGDNNVSCGRIVLNEGTRQNDVESFCSVSNSSYQNGGTWLSIETTQFGQISCVFYSGRLSECFENN